MNDQTLAASALLVDNDGVLVDSLAAIAEAFARWGDLHGMDGAAIYREHGGQRSVDIARTLFGDEKGPNAALELDQLEIESAPLVRALPGACEFLSTLDGRWTLVTSGPRALALARLRAAELPMPELIVAADDISAGKPSPESYLTAARLNGTNAEECVAIEDSFFGVRAAVSAGCQTIKIGADDVEGPLVVTPSLTFVTVRPDSSGFIVKVRGHDV